MTARQVLTALLPFVRWFPITGAMFKADLIAGITVALVLVPQGMAYAQLAGLPVVYGLYASFIPVIVAALWGSLPQLHTGPVAMLSLMSAAAILPLAALGSDEFIALSVMLALLVGILRLGLGLLRMGILVNFLSSPVIIGFTNAAALIIGLSQLSKILNVPFPRTDSFIADLWTVIEQLPATHLPTLLFAFATLVLIVAAKRWLPKVPGVLLVVVLATLASWQLEFEHHYAAPIAAIQDSQSREQVSQFIENLNEINVLSHTSSMVARSIRRLDASDHDDYFAELALLEADLRVLRHDIDVRQRINNQRQVELHNLRFESVIDKDGEPLFFLRDQAPPELVTDGRTWRISRIREQEILFMAGGEVVGAIPSGLPQFNVPQLQLDSFWALLPSALVMALIGFMEATSISKAIAAQTKVRVDTSKELIGQGLANIVGSFFNSYTVSGSFSRSAVAAKTGAQTGLFSIISALAVMLVLLYLTPLLYHLPQAVLAVIVMMAVFGLINVRGLIRAWQIERQEAIVGVITFLATLIMAPQLANGILLGAGLSILLWMLRTMKPRVDVIGWAADGSLTGVRGSQQTPLGEHFIAVRFDGSLNFVTASHFEDMLLDARARNPQARAVLVIGSGINMIDVSGEERLRDVIDNFRDNGIAIYFSSLKTQVYQALERGHLFDVLGREHFFRNKEQALRFMQATYDQKPTIDQAP